MSQCKVMLRGLLTGPESAYFNQSRFLILARTSGSSNEFLVLKVLGSQEFQERVAEQVRVFTIVETEAHFIQIGLQVLCANTMPRSHNAALKQRKCGFNPVRVDVTVHIFAVAVTNSFVFCKHASVMQRLRVSLKFVRHNYINVSRDVFLDVLRQGSRLHILGMKEPEFSPALLDTDNHLLFALRMADFVLMAALHSVSTVEGLDQPWSRLARQVGRMQVSSTLMDCVYIASGVVAPRGWRPIASTHCSKT